MALSLKQCLLLVVVLWQVTNIVESCLGVCACSITPLCQRCSYNISLKENGRNHQVTECCDKESQLATWLENNVNKTILQVQVTFGSPCNATIFDFDSHLLETVSLIIRNGTFNKIKINVKPQSLREMDLSSNKLQYISKGVFNKFTNLRKLILSKNEIISIFEESFNGLTNLESLDLSENNLTSLANVFTPLKKLQHLNLSRNHIEFINENYFNNWLLQHLDVSHNNLRKLAPGALQLLPNLARLLLTDNPHLGVTQLDTQLLVGTGRRLQQIDASRTGLYQVPEAFTHSVRFLSLVGNRISSIRCGDLDSYPLLQSLDFSDNKIVSVEDDSLGRLEMLLFLNINKNILTSVPKSLPDELKYLSINNNLIKNLSIADFKNLPNLRILMLKNNEIRYIEDYVFEDLLSLEMLDLSDNPIQSFSPNIFDGPLSLRDLRLCHLNVSAPAQARAAAGSFPMSSPESVQMLHLQASPALARQLLADSAALAAFSHLQYLDLRMNNLSHIRNDLLFYLAQLKTLRLHGNNINCSAELWLRDWMIWNKSLSDGETCYYSTTESKADMTKYNCTFPETFTISESLPPVNLYSTEMINKLLRYYGYINNKTEKASNRRIGSKNNNTYVKEIGYKDKMSLIDKLKTSRNENSIFQSNDYLNDTVLVKARESSKVLDQNKLQNDQFHVDHKFLDIEPFSLNHETKKVKPGEISTSIARKTKSGKRLNTPVNVTKKMNFESDGNIESKDEHLLPTSVSFENGTARDKFSTNTIDKTEYSPYKSSHPSYAQYIGTVAVSGLIALSLVLWVSFRLRYRRRHSVVDTETQDQIEVANISGGVLW